jgi:hypothetical protein
MDGWCGEGFLGTWLWLIGKERHKSGMAGESF